MKRKCCFLGHRDLAYGEIKDKLKSQIENLILKESIFHYLVGNYGSFDRLVPLVFKELKEKYPNLKLELVIPYVTKEINEYSEYYHKNYDGIVISNIPINTPRRLKIIKNNEIMINESDFVICYIDHSWGGAYTSVEYARKKSKKIINIYER